MSKLKVDQFVDLVKKSGLVDNQRLNEALSGVDQSVKDSGAVASILTKADLLTEWQSEKLLQGRYKGFHLGRYKLLKHLGTGGMGAVYLAEHLVMQHRVAIKLLASHLAAHKSYLERFLQEARASAKLNHKNMVKAYDVDHDGNNHYLVMEFVDGCDLQAIVSRHGPLPYRTAAEYARQAAEGLAYAHRSGLIHRDIKPANLLVDREGTVKILDMGLARFTDESQGSLTKEYDQKMIGTVDYQPPEQAFDSHRVDARADVYSLGCTLYFMLSGDAPFPTGTIAQRVMQHQSCEPADVRKQRPDAPAGLLAIYKKMMAKSPDDRYQSAEEVSQALADWLGDKQGATRLAEEFEKAPPPTGPSLNENLTLAPLDEDLPHRGGPKPTKDKETKPASKSGAAAGAAAAKKPDPSGLKKGPPPAKAGEAHAGAKASLGKPGSALPDLNKEDDFMDELLAAPSANSSVLPAPPLASARKKDPEPSIPIWLIALGGVAVTIIVALVGAMIYLSSSGN